MTKRRSFKRLVRRHARESAERYTQALARMPERPAREIQGGAEPFDLAEALRTAGARDWTTLRTLRDQAEQQIEPDGPLDVTFARALCGLYRRLDDPAATVRLLDRLLTQPLDVETEAWARHRLLMELTSFVEGTTGAASTDATDLERAVTVHRELIDWGRSALDPERWYWLLGLSTCAYAWREAGAIEQWLDAWREISAEAPATPANRHERLHAIASAAFELSFLGDTDEAFAVISQIDALVDEDPDWDHAILAIETRLHFEMNVHAQRGDIERMREVGEHALEFVNAHPEHSWLAHNLGARFCWEQQYDLAIPLFERCVAADETSNVLWLWFAAATWATTHARAETVRMLREAATRSHNGSILDAFRQTEEFADVVDDEELVAAASGG